MRTRKTIPILFMILALLLAACSSEAPAGNLPDEPYEPVAYNLFPIPDDAYVGDVMPFVTEDGTLELYYLYDTDHNGQAYHPVWKYSTANLYQYENHGEVMPFGLMSDPDPAIGTGSVMQDQEGLYHLFYTGHNDTGNGGNGKECVMQAVSTDRENWEKQGVVFFAPEGYSKDDFRDPEVFWAEEDQCYWLLIAARNDIDGGVVLKFTSPDLKEWTCEGPIFAPHAQYMLECPDLFNIDGTWYLTYSWDCRTYYAVGGTSMKDPFTAPDDNVLDGTSETFGGGFIFYAAKTAQKDGNTYLCGWIGRAGLSADSAVYQWAGNVLNHQLVKLEDGRLGVKAPDTYAQYFTADKPFQAVKKEGKVQIKDNNITLSAQEGAYALADMGTRAPSMTLECDVTIDAGGRAGFAFGGSEADETYTVLAMDAGEGLIRYEGYEIPDLAQFPAQAFTRFDFSSAEVHHVKLVCENEIVVCYIDDTKALSSRISHSTGGAHIGVFSDGCGASFQNITVKLPE